MNGLLRCPASGLRLPFPEASRRLTPQPSCDTKSGQIGRLMKLPFVASCVGLLLVSQLGVSSATTTDPLSVSLSEFTTTLCDPASITEPLEPEAASTCFEASLTFLSVKQLEEPKSSGSLAQGSVGHAPDPGSVGHDSLAFGLDPGPATPGPMVAMTGPVKETLVVQLRSGAKPYQLEDNHD